MARSSSRKATDFGSTAAWLAVNHAEVRTPLVDTFTLKGFPEPEAVYRVEQTHRTRGLADQYTVFTDLRGFVAFAEIVPMTIVERVLDTLSELIALSSREFGGTVRFNAGDAHCVTFGDAGLAMAAVEGLHERWSAFQQRERIVCPMILVVHQGMLYAFRSYLYGRALAVAVRVLRRLQPVDVATAAPHLTKIEIYRLAKTESNS